MKASDLINEYNALSIQKEQIDEKLYNHFMDLVKPLIALKDKQAIQNILDSWDCPSSLYKFDLTAFINKTINS